MYCKQAKIQGVQYKELRITKNEHQTPEYTKINPNQQLPAILEEDEKTGERFGLGESHAIMRYLNDTREEAPGSLYPKPG